MTFSCRLKKPDISHPNFDVDLDAIIDCGLEQAYSCPSQCGQTNQSYIQHISLARCSTSTRFVRPFETHRYNYFDGVKTNMAPVSEDSSSGDGIYVPAGVLRGIEDVLEGRTVSDERLDEVINF